MTQHRSPRPARTALEQRLLAAMEKIASHQAPGVLHQQSRRESGIDGAQAIEAAYAAVIEIARRETKRAGPSGVAGG